MKHSTKTIALCIIAIAVAITIAAPQQSFAASDAKKPKATNVRYVTKNDVKTGVRSFTIEPYSYYNLSQSQIINPANERTIKLNDAKLLQIAKSEIFPRWGIIAEGIFRDQADQLVTIQGSGMMSNSTTSSNSFDRHFSTGSVANGYTDDWAVSDLAESLSKDTSSQTGKTCWDETRITGITQIGNLSDARTLMGQELRNCSDDNDVSKDEFLGNSHQKNEDKRRLPDLENDKTGAGFANIVTCVNRAGASGDYDYVSFGIAVYDFDITPVAAENLKYIEEADNTFENGVKGQDILMGLAGDHVDKTGISFHNDTENGTTSYIRNNTTQEVTQSSGLENSVTEESTISTDDTFEWGMEQEIGLELNFGGFGGIGAGSAENPAPCMFPRATVNISNSWHELWSTTKSKSETQSTTKTKTTNTEVTLPGHTVATVNQSLNNKKTTENYQQPVILNYKVAVFAMSGDYYNGIAGGIENNRYDKQWMSVIFDGSDDYENSGCDALGSLYNRGITNADNPGYDGAKGKYRCWCDKAAWTKSSKIDWNSISSKISEDTRDSHRITLGSGKSATTIQDLATELPLIEKAQMLTSKRESITSSVDQIIPLYSLGSVGMKSGSKEYDITPQDTLYLDSIDMEGSDRKDAEFYEFDKAWGEWVLLDGNEDVIEAEPSDDDSQTVAQDGNIMLISDTESGSQKVVASEGAEGTNEKHRLKWRLKPGEGTKIASNEELNRPQGSEAPPYMTDEEKEEVDTPTISVYIKDRANDIRNFEIEGTCKVPWDETVNLGHVFTVNAIDESGKIRGVPVSWESRGITGINVEESGETTFTKKGTYQVRPFSIDMDRNKIVPRDESNNPIWLEVVAQDKTTLGSIVINKPEFDEDDVTLTEGTPSLGFDLGSYTKFLDQYGDKWEGTKEDPLPEVKYGVSGPNGADIDGEDVLTITRPGTYTVNARAFDQNGEDIGMNINTIKITVTEAERLTTIEMDEPALSKNERTLKKQGDCVVVQNLKGLLTYVDQHGDEWTGKKPNVTFSIDGDPEDAEIKGGNFYAYSPGTYIISPAAAEYKIDPISIEILEDSRLILKTEDPGRQYLYTDDDVAELELERYVNATTGFGGKWKGDVPELTFTLADGSNATIEARTVYEDENDFDGTDRHYFKTNVTGEYLVHVAPKKASEYTEPIDDIFIRVTKGKKVARIEFRDITEEEERDAFTINKYTSDYPEIDLSKYLKYYDGFGDPIDPAKDHVKIPDCEYTLMNPEGLSAESYDLDREIFTAYEPDYYLIEASMNVTNNDPSAEEPKEDEVLEAATGFMIYDINWQHDFGDWEVTESTCTADGSRVKRCSGGEGCINHEKGLECNEEIVETIPASGHKWSGYKYSVTDHMIYTVCEVCGTVNEDSKTRILNQELPKHMIGDGTVRDMVGEPDATCTEPGRYRIMRGDSERILELPALGHQWENSFETIEEPTCTEFGIEGIRCGRTDKDHVAVHDPVVMREGEGCQRTIQKLEHVADEDGWHYAKDGNGTEIKETCEDHGLKVTKCRNCDTDMFQFIAPFDHDWDDGVIETPATFAENGVRKFTCKHNPEHTKTEFIPATGGQEGAAAAAEANAAIGNAAAIDEAVYSKGSYAAVAKAKEELQQLLADPGATLTQVKTATEKLNAAMSSLKMDQILNVKAAKKTVKVKKVRKKAQTVKPLTVKGQKTTVTYKGVPVGKKAKKALKINARTGKITVRKKTKKGTYQMKVTVTAAASKQYESATKTVIVKIRVR